MNFERFDIDKALPQGYRLATVDEVVRYGYNRIRRGKSVDVQEFGNDYFNFYCRPLDFNKTHLKDGFIDNRRNLAWPKFEGLCVVDKLAVAAPPPDVKLSSSYSSSSPAMATGHDDPRVVALLYACVEENVDEIKDLIRDFGEEIMLINLYGVPCGGNALHYCAWEGKIKSLEFLLRVADKNMVAKSVANLDDGETPLLVAAYRGYVQDGKAVRMLLQFDNSQINTPSKKFCLTPLAMAISCSHSKMVCDDLLKEEDIKIDFRDHLGSTALHLVVQYSPALSDFNVELLQLLLHYCKLETNDFLDKEKHIKPTWDDCNLESIGKSNIQHLHSIRLNSKRELEDRRRFVNIKNDKKETALQRALVGIFVLPFPLPSYLSKQPTIGLHLVSLLIWAGADVERTDMKGKTALHQACKIHPGFKVEGTEFEVANTIVCILQKCFGKKSDLWFEYAGKADISGQTALHKAIYMGNVTVVRTLFSFVSNDNDNNTEEFKEKVKKLVHKRDFLGKTTLHMAVISKSKNIKDKMEMVKTLLKHAGDKERYLLLWAISEDLGTALSVCNKEGNCKELADYLDIEMSKSQQMNLNILEIALEENRPDMIVELINRDADVEHKLVKDKKDLVKIQERYKTITSDQASSKDFLDRKDITSGIATLLLNQRTGSPVTIGIYGGTGMGKSSLMKQVKCLMLTIAAKQAPSLLKNQPQSNNNESHNVNQRRNNANDFPGVKKLEKVKPSRLPQDILKLVKRYVPQLTTDKDGGNEEQAVNRILSSYKRELAPIFKRLALRNHGANSVGRPALLTIEYNASQYNREKEAWAGIAVEISKEMVRSCMTAGQELRISWLYAFRKNPQVFVTNVILPAIIIVFLGGFIGWLAWKLLSIPGSPLLKKFQYGSIPLSVIIVVWLVLDKILNNVKPVAETLGNQYKGLSSIGEENLGLQNRVIDDIQFLKNEIYITPFFIWNWIAFFWRWFTLILGGEKSLESSDDLKCIPEKDSLRIVAFIDNLDRHKEELLMRLNPVLSACDINVVIAIDKELVEDVIQKNFGASNSESSAEDMAMHQPNRYSAGEKILDQLIQLPIVLPDPSVKQLKDHFLKKYLRDSSKGTGEENIGLEIFHEFDGKDNDDANAEGPDELQLNHNFDAYYTEGEMEVFEHLVQHAFATHRSPRKWKSLLNYHRLVRSILSYPSRQETMNVLEGWKRQLIIWVFFCWQWKEQMDAIIENWSALVQVPNHVQFVWEAGSTRALSLMLPLSSPRTHCWLDYTLERLHIWKEKRFHVEEREATLKCTREERSKAIDEIYPSLYKIVQLRRQQIFKDSSDMKELERMSSTLKMGHHDVTMSAILAFQEFRFGCKPCYLPLVVPNMSEE